MYICDVGYPRSQGRDARTKSVAMIRDTTTWPFGEAATGAGIIASDVYTPCTKQGGGSAGSPLNALVPVTTFTLLNSPVSCWNQHGLRIVRPSSDGSRSFGVAAISTAVAEP